MGGGAAQRLGYRCVSYADRRGEAGNVRELRNLRELRNDPNGRR